LALGQSAFLAVAGCPKKVPGVLECGALCRESPSIKERPIAKKQTKGNWIFIIIARDLLSCPPCPLVAKPGLEWVKGKEEVYTIQPRD